MKISWRRVFVTTAQFIGGLIYGVLGTVAHRALVSIFGTGFPLGLTLALVGVAAITLGTRLLSTRLAATSVCIGIIVAVWVLANEGVGGSVLVVDSAVDPSQPSSRGLIWLYGSIIIAALVMVWPRLPKSRTKLES